MIGPPAWILCRGRGRCKHSSMGRADEHAPLLTRGRGSRLDNRLALWGDNSNVKRAGFIATLALLGLVALVVVRPPVLRVAAPYRLLFFQPPRVCRASRLAPSLPNRVSPSQTQGRTSHVNQVNSLNLRRESAEKLARRNNAYRDARCSVSWIVHTGALSGGAALEETVRDLQRIAGVAANKEWMPDGTTRIKYGVPQFLQVPSLPKDFDFATEVPGGDGSFDARLSRTIREPLLRAIDAGHRGAYTVSHGVDAPGLLTMETFVTNLRKNLDDRRCDLVVVAAVRDPAAHRVGEWIHAHASDPDLFIDRELTAVLRKTPGFPVGEGAVLFPQTRALLFAGELASADARDALRERLSAGDKTTGAPENPALAGVGAKEALEAFQFVDGVVAEVERRAANDSPHATLAGVLAAKDSLKTRFDLAKSLLAKVTQRFVNAFDVVLVAKSDEHEGSRRLAEKLDWRAEALRDPSTDESVALARSIAKNASPDFADGGTVTDRYRRWDLSGLPFETRRAVARWGELDGALFLVAEAQRERLKTVEDANRLGAATYPTGAASEETIAAREAATRRASPVELCGDAKRRGVTDAAELVRLSFEKEGGSTPNLRARVRDEKGCLDGALRFLREADATPVPAEVVRAERGGSYHAAASVAMEASTRPGSPREEAYPIALKNRGVKAR